MPMLTPSETPNICRCFWLDRPLPQCWYRCFLGKKGEDMPPPLGCSLGVCGEPGSWCYCENGC